MLSTDQTCKVSQESPSCYISSKSEVNASELQQSQHNINNEETCLQYFMKKRSLVKYSCRCIAMSSKIKGLNIATTIIFFLIYKLMHL